LSIQGRIAAFCIKPEDIDIACDGPLTIAVQMVPHGISYKPGANPAIVEV
jgi:hypothetical protein